MNELDFILLILYTVNTGLCAVPTSLTPTIAFLPEYENVTDYSIGQFSKLQMVVAFPFGVTSDVNIELLSSTNVTVMALGDITVTKKGTNLDIGVPSPVKYETMETQTSAVKIYDRGVFTIGDINNSASDPNYEESTLVIEFEAVVASVDAVSDMDVHWVSSGMEYNDSYNVWIGQVSHTIRTQIPNITANSSFEMMDVGGYTIKINTPRVLRFKAWVPYAYSTIAAEAVVLTNTTDSLHVVDVRLVDAGDNYKHMIDFNKAMDYQTTCTRSRKRRLDLENVYNTGPYDSSSTTDDNMLLFEAYLFLEDEVQVGDEFALGVGVEVSATEIWATYLNMTVEAADTPSPSSPPAVVLAPQGPTSINEGDGIVIEANLTTSENVSMLYTIDVETIHVGGGDPGMAVSLISVVSSGENIPCISTPTVSYTQHSSGVLNKGSLVANITNYGLLTSVLGSSANDILLRIALVANPGKAVPGETYRVTVTVQSADGSVDTDTIDYNINGSATYDTSVNYTFSLYHKCQKNCIILGSTYEFFVDITTQRDTSPGPVTIEFPVPANVTESMFSVCKYEIINIGKNVICVNNEAAVNATNVTTLHDGTYGRVVMVISPLCNVGLYDDENEDKFTLRIRINIKNDTEVENGTSDWFGIGIRYSLTQIYIAQYKLWAKPPTYYPDFAIVEGVIIDAADAANLTWPGNTTLQSSLDGSVYSSKNVGFTYSSSNGSHDTYTLSYPLITAYVRMIIEQCTSGCYVEHDYITSSVENYIDIFNDVSGDYMRRTGVAMDRDDSTCFSLPVQGTTPPVYWARLNTTLLQVTPHSFRLSVVGDDISCSPKAGTKALQVSYPTSSSIGKFHGDLAFCKNANEVTTGSKTTCEYTCNCPDEAQCSEVFIFLANTVEGTPWSLCEISASNI